jgi:hypothetical protein
MRISLVASALAVLYLLVLAGHTPRATRADVAVPRNFVSATFCEDLPTSAAARFVVPGAFDLNAMFGAQPQQIWIDITLFDNNFTPGTFIGAGPFGTGERPGGEFFVWTDLFKSRQHYYRLNALLSDGWREVGRGSFVTPDCGPVYAIECEPDGTNRVEWRTPQSVLGPERPALEQWIDLTLVGNPQNPEFDNGFLPGTFIGAGPFPPQGVRFVWRGIKPGLRHYSRLNVLHGGPPQIGAQDNWAWLSSSRFTSLDCRDLPQVTAGL